MRVVTKECGDRSATVLEKHLREKNIASWAAAGAEAWAEGRRAAGVGGGGGEGAGGAVFSAKALGQADALLEELAVLTQHTESYDRFVRFLVEEVCAGLWCAEAREAGGRGGESFIVSQENFGVTLSLVRHVSGAKHVMIAKNQVNQQTK